MSVPDDLAEFVEWLETLRGCNDALARWFSADQPVLAARAPGRLDVMGGIADYSGSLVLQMPIAQAACCAVQCTGTGWFEAVTVDPDDAETRRSFTGPIDLLNEPYAQLRARLGSIEGGDWAAYMLGPATVLVQEHGAAAPEGLRLLLRSNVPEGKGVSSSAAVELAVARALTAALGLKVEGRELALACQCAENHVAGAPCGVMDQLASALGRKGKLLALRCQPAEVIGHRPIPGAWRVWGIDSGIRHAVSGSDYGSVRAGTFMGYRYIAYAAGLRAHTLAPGRVRVDDPHWQGYLANLSPSEFESHHRCHLPEQIGGQAFLDAMGGTTDQVVPIDPAGRYDVRQPAAHAVYEHARVRLFAQLLQGPAEEETARLLGELMYQSHASYSACGLGSEGTDELVRLVREAGEAAGLYGAKITGGGSGGTVAVLGRADAAPAVRALAEQYRQHSGRSSIVFDGSSDGAMASEVVRV